MRGSGEELIARRDCADYILNLKRPPSDADPNAAATGVHAARDGLRPPGEQTLSGWGGGVCVVSFRR